MEALKIPFAEKPELELDVEMLRKFIKYNMHPDADIKIENNKIYVVLPLELLFKYTVAGDKIRIQLG